MKLLILNGPNLNMLGVRPAQHYGTLTLAEMNGKIAEFCSEKNVDVEFFQSNFEGELINALQTAKADAIILNAGAFTHYSYALRDAVECQVAPVVEVHLSDVKNREPFRKIDVFDGVVVAKFYGKKLQSYLDAINFLLGESE